jgi:hypothetical protein
MTSLTEKRIANILLLKAPISTGPRNLESTQKTTPERNLRTTIRTRVGIPKLDKKIGQPKKKEVQPRKGQKEHYINRNDNVRQEIQSDV